MKHLLLLLCLLAPVIPALAQQPVRGQVVAASDNTPLPGASVVLVGTTSGTTADATGHFTLPAVHDSSMLLVNFVGYKPRQVAVPSPLPIPWVIALEENVNQLGEVVVSTGYQQLPAERATGSFAQVSREQLNEQVGPDVLSRLEAVANGLTVNRGTNDDGLMIRGLSSIQGPTAPLIVVDNFPYEGDLDNLNPNDVESITLLKDAAAASIWGARAGNGVIVITTKKSKYNQPLAVDFATHVSFTPAPDLQSISQVSSSDFIDVEQLLFEKGYYNSQVNASARPALTPVVEILLAKANGTLTEQQAQEQLDALRKVDIRNEYARHMYQQAVNQQYSLRFRGGTATHAWLLSGGYDRNLSELAAGYNRLNLRTQHTLRPLKRLELQTDLAYTRSQRTSGRPGYGDVAMLPGYLYPYARFADENGNPLPVSRDHRQFYKNAAGNGQVLDWQYYPLTDYQHDYTTFSLQEILGQAGLRYQLFDGLEADIRYQYQHQQVTGEHVQDAQSYAARHLVNRFIQVDPTTGAVTYAVPKGGLLDLSRDLTRSYNARGQLNFTREGEKHAITALAGGEARSTRVTGNSQRLYGYQEDILSYGEVDYRNRYPTAINGSLAFIPNNTYLADKLNRFVSVFGNAAYTYLGRYTLSVSGRQDASNLFGVKANERWKPLWSSGLAWDLSREPFYKVGFLPYLKLRATYGLSGNVHTGMAAVTTMAYRSSLSAQTLVPTASFSNYANPELTWETARMLNLGMDFSLVGDRLSGSLEYYAKKGENLFGFELLDYTTGIGADIVKNVAAMEGRGIDVALQASPIRTSTLRWETDLNVSYAQEEVTDYFLGSSVGSRFVSNTPAISAEAGRAIYGIYSYKWAGLDPATGEPQGYLEGQVSKDYTALTGAAVLLSDLNYHGSALPTWFGSLGNTFTYKKLSLTARISYNMGYFFRRPSINYGNLFANGMGHGDFANRWQQPGDEAFTDVPALYYPIISSRETFYAGSAALVGKGDHVRLQYITASYEFGKAGHEKGLFRQLRAFANISNLGLLWAANSQGIDPDRNLNPAVPAPAVTYALGVNASF